MRRAAVVVFAFVAAHAVELIRELATTCACQSELSATRAVVDKIAGQRYMIWSIETGRECPASFEELGVGPTGPRGQRLLMLCGDLAPPEARGFGVVAAGADRLLGTCDDVTSWEQFGDQFDRCGCGASYFGGFFENAQSSIE